MIKGMCLAFKTRIVLDFQVTFLFVFCGFFFCGNSQMSYLFFSVLTSSFSCVQNGSKYNIINQCSTNFFLNEAQKRKVPCIIKNNNQILMISKLLYRTVKRS